MLQLKSDSILLSEFDIPQVREELTRRAHESAIKKGYEAGSKDI